MVAESSKWTVSPALRLAPSGPTMNAKFQQRMILWVDAVGGFLLCPNHKVVIGQAIPSSGVDIAIQADISRRHATIYRDGEGYLIMPATNTSIDGRDIDAAHYLSESCTIGLGSHVRLLFQKPHPLSGSARLKIASHHRSEPAVDGVLLTADSIVLGPNPTSHVIVRDTPNDLIVYRGEKRWMFRTSGPFEIDGRRVNEPVPIEPGSRVSGRDFSLSLESV